MSDILKMSFHFSEYCHNTVPTISPLLIAAIDARFGLIYPNTCGIHEESLETISTYCVTTQHGQDGTMDPMFRYGPAAIFDPGAAASSFWPLGLALRRTHVRSCTHSDHAEASRI
jgi:hypothetical protein